MENDQLVICELSSDQPERLRQAMNIYENAFPEEERVRPEALLAAIREREQAATPLRAPFHFQIALQDQQVVGLAIFYYDPQTRLGFIPYLAVDTRRRNSGIGASLYRHLVATIAADGEICGEKPALGVTFEVERPELGADPASQEMRRRRVGFYQRNGAVIVPNLNFVAPPMAPHLPEVGYILMLHPLPACPWPLGRAEIEAVLTTACNSYDLSPASPYYQRALAF